MAYRKLLPFDRGDGQALVHGVGAVVPGHLGHRRRAGAVATFGGLQPSIVPFSVSNRNSDEPGVPLAVADHERGLGSELNTCPVGAAPVTFTARPTLLTDVGVAPCVERRLVGAVVGHPQRRARRGVRARRGGQPPGVDQVGVRQLCLACLVGHQVDLAVGGDVCGSAGRCGAECARGQRAGGHDRGHRQPASYAARMSRAGVASLGSSSLPDVGNRSLVSYAPQTRARPDEFTYRGGARFKNQQRILYRFA